MSSLSQHGDVDQVRRRRILPDRGVDAIEADRLVEPAGRPDRRRHQRAESRRCTCGRPASADYPRSPPWRAFRRDPSGTGERAAAGDRRLGVCARRAGCGLATRCTTAKRVSDMPLQARSLLIGSVVLIIAGGLIGWHFWDSRCEVLKPDGGSAVTVMDFSRTSRSIRCPRVGDTGHSGPDRR